MTHPSLIIIGAGPAGLMAARTAARLGLSVLLFEGLSRPGDLGHPCSGAIAPVPGFVEGFRQADGLHFPRLELTIPTDLIIGMPTVQRYISPGGFAFEARFAPRDNFPIAVIDKSALLKTLAREAQEAGAELRFGTPVRGLLKEGERVVGVQTHLGGFHAPLVLSAEGASRRFTEEAGLYEGLSAPKRYAYIVSETLMAPTATEAIQIATLGRRYTTAQLPTFGTVMVPDCGQASVYFSLFADEPQLHLEASLWHYLEEYKANDPRVSGLLAGATTLSRTGTRMTLRPIPPRVTVDGFMGVGDSVGPGGHVGILPCLFLGRKAALVAYDAVRAADTSHHSLKNYERLYQGSFQRGLNTEYRIINGLVKLQDVELDRICETLSPINLAPFFIGEWRPMLKETVRWLVRALPLILRDVPLLWRVMH